MYNLYNLDYNIRVLFPEMYKSLGEKPEDLINFAYPANYYSRYENRLKVKDTLFPLFINNIMFDGYAFTIPDNQTQELKEHTKNRIKNIIDLSDDNKLNIINIFSHDINSIDEYIPQLIEAESDALTAYKEIYKTQVNRNLEDYGLVPGDYSVRIFKHPTKHILVCVHNYYDTKQHRPLSFSMSLINVVFEDINEMFNFEEQEYFREMRHQLSLKRMSKTIVEDKLNTVLHSQKVRDFINDKQLTIIINNVINQRENTLNNLIQRKYHDIEGSLTNYSNALREYQDLKTELVRYQNNKDSLIEEYNEALSYDWIKNVNIGDTSLKFDILTYADYYDTDLLECFINGYSTYDDEVKCNYITFLKEVFLKGKYKFKIQAHFNYSFNHNSRFLENRPVTIDDHAFNPHLYYYSCLGTYKTHMIKAEAEQNLISFVNLALASTRSINFADGAVTSRWREAFDPHDYYNILDVPCIECEDGTSITPKQLFDRVNNEVVEEPEETNVVGTIAGVEIRTTDTPQAQEHQEGEEVEAEFIW